MKTDKKYNDIMLFVKMNRSASRNADLEFKIPKVLHRVTEDKKKKSNKNFCKNFKF